jgi:hypothetical protein
MRCILLGFACPRIRQHHFLFGLADRTCEERICDVTRGRRIHQENSDDHVSTNMRASVYEPAVYAQRERHAVLYVLSNDIAERRRCGTREGLPRHRSLRVGHAD